MTHLQEQYKKMQPNLSTELGIKNIHALPKIEKIVVNIGTGETKGDQNLQKLIQDGLALITGQKAVATKAKKSIAGFKLREGDEIGYRVTLRGKRMYDFLYRMITYVFPRLRDFQGMPLTGFDKQGNYSFGFREQATFPEIPYEATSRVWGFQVTIVTTAKNKEEAKALLQGLGFPFAKPKDKAQE